jgi:hypothetical protein
MPRSRTFRRAATILLLLSLTLTACTNDTKSDEAETPTPASGTPTADASPTPSPAAASGVPAPARQWDATAVGRDWGEPGNSGLWVQHCGKTAPTFNPDTAGGMGCVFEVMKAAGAGPEAVAFFREYGVFLVSFQELGSVDHGMGAAPWYSMGLPSDQLLLNGIPVAYRVNDDMLDAFNSLRLARTTSSAPGDTYTDVLAKNVIASPDRAKLSPPVPVQGGLAYTFDVPLQTCRACPMEGYMPVQFLVANDGTVLGNTLQPFKGP